jgi:signal transduction histidine kinase
VRRPRGRVPASGHADLANSTLGAADSGVAAAEEAFLRLLVLAADLQDRQLAEQEELADRQQLQTQVRQAELQTRQLLACQEAERRHLARQLHDGIGQLLAAICMQLHMAKDLGGQTARVALDECLGVVEQAIAQVRGLSLDLIPPLLDDFGLLAALRGHLDCQAERAGLAVNLVASASLGQLPSELETACFRVTEAALANVIAHASAQHVQVELRRDAEAVYLAIRDDGVGFDPQSVERRTGGPTQRGLPAMRQRVALLGGSCRIESAPGQGTVIQVCWPLGDRFAEPVTGDSAKRLDDDEPRTGTDSARAEDFGVFRPGRQT